MTDQDRPASDDVVEEKDPNGGEAVHAPGAMDRVLVVVQSLADRFDSTEKQVAETHRRFTGVESQLVETNRRFTMLEEHLVETRHLMTIATFPNRLPLWFIAGALVVCALVFCAFGAHAIFHAF